MALYTELPIYQHGCALLTLALQVQTQLPRAFKRTLASAIARLEHLPQAQVYATGNSYLGLASQPSHGHHQQAQIARALMKRGHAVDGDLSRIFRSSNG